MKADLTQFREIFEQASDVKVIRVIDRRFRTQRPALLEILFDRRIFVNHLETRDHVLRHDARPELRRRRLGDFTPENELHVFRPAHRQVVADDLFEEQASVLRTVEDLSQRQFDLKNGIFVIETGVVVGFKGREGRTTICR